MTANTSKTRDPRFWNKWRSSGAVGSAPQVEEFIVTTSFANENDRFFNPFTDVRFSQLQLIETPKGRVVTFQAYDSKARPYSVVAGYFAGHLPPSEFGLKRMSVSPVPKNQRSEITNIVRDQDYKGPVNFW